MKKFTTKHDCAPCADVNLCENLCVDLAKQVFQLAGDDGTGRVIYEA
ncbi:IS110 family transposase, partial [Pantoea sp. Tr-811]|nr:IS110 family transposase [Pantoea sp. Tr-811]